MRTTTKQRKSASLESWFKKFRQEFPGISYRLAETDFQAVTKGMTADQIQFTLSMVCAGHAIGSETSRKFWSPKYHAMRIAAERATGRSDISYSGIKLVK